MIKAESSIKIIKDAINALTFPITIKTVTTNTNGTFTLSVSNNWHAQPGFPITINSVVYKITDIDYCSITVKGSPTPTVGIIFQLYKPFFFHGTPIKVGEDLAAPEISEDAFKKTPMIYFVENFRDEYYNITDIRDRDINVSLFFLSQNDPENFTTKDSYKYVVEPMRRLFEVLESYLEQKRGIFYMQEGRPKVENFANFGVYVKDRGILKSAWNDKLAGCERIGIITLMKQWICAECDC